MKGAYILLEKNDVLIRTQYIGDKDKVRWMEGDVTVSSLLAEGYEILKENMLTKGLQELEKLRDCLCYGHKVSNKDLLDVINLLREY